MGLSKVSQVSFAVAYGGAVVSQTTLTLAHGTHSLIWRPPHAGSWTITLSGVDEAGNHGQASAPATILPPPPHHHHHHTARG